MRPIADELVVAVDDRDDGTVVVVAASFADVVVRVPYVPPFERSLAWLHARCSGDWIFRIDTDETPSPALLSALPDACVDAAVTHCWFPRRWLYPDESRYLATAPWKPDYQLRLVRNDPALLRFPGLIHTSVEVAGPARFVDAPLYHADLVLNSLDERRRKAEGYERTQPGLRTAGRPTNYFYLPEEWPEAATAAVPPVDREAVGRMRHGSAPPAPPRPQVVVRTADREEVDAHWEGRLVPESAYCASVTVEDPGVLEAGAAQTVDVRVENLGTETWPGGREARPEIRLAYRWRAVDGELLPSDGIRTAFPAPVGPGASTLVPTTVIGPPDEGRYVLEVDLVHEHVRWFGCDAHVTVDVRHRERTLLLMSGSGAFRQVGADSILVANLRQLARHAPDVRPILLGEEAAALTHRFGHEAAQSVHRFLYADVSPRWSRLRRALHLTARTRELRRNARRVRRGLPPRLAPHAAGFLASLVDADAVLSAGADGPRQRWSESATILAAHALDVPVVITSATIGPFDSFIERMIAAIALRKAAVVGVRGRGRSARPLRRIGVPQERILEGWDDSVALAPAPPLVAREALQRAGLPTGAPFAAVSLHNSRQARESLPAVAAVLRDLKDAGLATVFVPMCVHGDQDDRRFADELRSALGDRDAVLLLDPLPPDDVVRAVVAEATLAIGTRFHLSVFAAAVGVPAIGIYGDADTETKLRGQEDLRPDLVAVVPGGIPAADLVALARQRRAAPGGAPAAEPRLPVIRFLDRAASLNKARRRAGSRERSSPASRA